MVATLLRGAGHGEHDDASYVSADVKARFGDCLTLSEKKLLAEKLVTPAELAAWRDEATASITKAIEQTMTEPFPDPAKEDWCAYSERNLSERLIDRGPLDGGAR